MLHWSCTGQSFPADDSSIGKILTKKFREAGGGVEWKRAEMLKARDDNEPYHLFNKVRSASAAGQCFAMSFVLCAALRVAWGGAFLGPGRVACTASLGGMGCSSTPFWCGVGGFFLAGGGGAVGTKCIRMPGDSHR